jgi:hypothetical protein
MFTSNDMNTADDGDSFADVYLGPESDFDSMEAGCSIEDLGGLIKFKANLFEIQNNMCSISGLMMSLANKLHPGMPFSQGFR